MKKSITLQGKKIEYTIKKSRRSKYVRLAIHEAQLVVTVPRLVSFWSAEKFILQKAAWIVKKIEFFQHHSLSLTKQYPMMNYQADKAGAEEFVQERVEYYNRFYDFDYNRLRVKNNKHGWGSCSSKRNLNFNYRLMFLSPELVDYIVVHELCHLREMNHSARFWKLVAKIFPDYKERIKELRRVVW